MPQLKQLHCCIQWAETGAPFKEYGTAYGDGVVETYVVVPNKPQSFTIRLRSRGFISEGLAMVVFIDGNYQVNRNRVNLKSTDHNQVSRNDNTEIDFLLRQKEKSQGNHVYIGRQWRFDNHNIVNDHPTGTQDMHFEDLGTIEILVLRCRAKHKNEAELNGSSSGEDSDILDERTGPEGRQQVGSVEELVIAQRPSIGPPPLLESDDTLPLAGLFDGAGDYDYHPKRTERLNAVPGRWIWHQRQPPSNYATQPARMYDPRSSAHFQNPYHPSLPPDPVYNKPTKHVHWDYGPYRPPSASPKLSAQHIPDRPPSRTRMRTSHFRPADIAFDTATGPPYAPQNAHSLSGYGHPRFSPPLMRAYHRNQEDYSDEAPYRPQTPIESIEVDKAFAGYPDRPYNPFQTPLNTYSTLPTSFHNLHHESSAPLSHDSQYRWPHNTIPLQYADGAYYAAPTSRNDPYGIHVPNIPNHPAHSFHPHVPSYWPQRQYHAREAYPSVFQGPHEYQIKKDYGIPTCEPAAFFGAEANGNTTNGDQESLPKNEPTLDNNPGSNGWGNEPNQKDSTENVGNEPADNTERPEGNDKPNEDDGYWNNSDNNGAANTTDWNDNKESNQNDESWNKQEDNTNQGWGGDTGAGESTANDNNWSTTQNNNANVLQAASELVNGQMGSQNCVRDLYGPHGAYYTSNPPHEGDAPPDVEEGPRFDVPEHIASARGSTKQVQPGPGYRYFKKSTAPEYIDTLDEPYARFVFKYRTKAQLKTESGIEVEEEPTSNQEVRELQDMDKQTLIEMLMRAKSALGGRVPSPPPIGQSIPTSNGPILLEPPSRPYSRYSIPQPRPPVLNAANAANKPNENVVSSNENAPTAQPAGWNSADAQPGTTWNDTSNAQPQPSLKPSWDGTHEHATATAGAEKVSAQPQHTGKMQTQPRTHDQVCDQIRMLDELEKKLEAAAALPSRPPDHLRSMHGGPDSHSRGWDMGGEAYTPRGMW